MDSTSEKSQFDAVVCPACGLLCDDLAIKRETDGSLHIKANGCHKSKAFFERPPEPAFARVSGQVVDLGAAIEKIASILKNSRQPLIAGLGTEVQGMRAIMSLADKAGATIDHMNSTAAMRNTQVVQNSGWQTCTLTEVRNRVDLLVIVGTDIVSVFPRFFERMVWNKETMFGQETSAREVVYLGGRNIDTSAGTSPDGRKPEVLPCDTQHIPEVIAVLRALINGKKIAAAEVAGISLTDLDKLAERLKSAKYSVIAWAAGVLDFPHAELAVQNITEMVKTLNLTTRSSGLPLGGIDGDMSANQVSAWISGYPVRTSYASGHPEYDPYHFSADRLLQSGEADALLWISSFSPEKISAPTSIPTVVLGRPGMTFEREPDVFIPIGTPGLDHKGVVFRMDNVVSLPLEQLRPSSLPMLGEVLGAVERRL